MASSSSPDIDPDTGLPVLPEGYFWNVQQAQNPTNSYSYRKTTTLTLRIMKHTRGFWGNKVRTTVFSHSVELQGHVNVTKVTAKETALRAYALFLAKLQTEAELRDILGDHMPKPKTGGK